MKKRISTIVIAAILLATVAGTVNAGERVTRHNRQQPVSRITRAASAPTSISGRRYSQPQVVGTPVPLTAVAAKATNRAGRTGR